MAPVAAPRFVAPVPMFEPRRRSRPLILVVALALTLALLPPLTGPAHADAGLESAFVTAANDARAAQGLPALAVAGDLTSAARAHSGVMGNSANLHHNPNLGSSVGGWQKLGENVGRGPSVGAIHRALMDSPSHRANILGGDWTQIGVGVVVVDGQVWVTQMFRQPVGASAPAPKPQQEPAPAPEPAASPEPAPEPAPATAAADPDADQGGSAEPGSDAADDSGDGAAGNTDAEPEPHPVAEQQLALDRTTLLLAKQDARERDIPLDEVLAELEEPEAA